MDHDPWRESKHGNKQVRSLHAFYGAIHYVRIHVGDTFDASYTCEMLKSVTYENISKKGPFLRKDK